MQFGLYETVLPRIIAIELCLSSALKDTCLVERVKVIFFSEGNLKFCKINKGNILEREVTRILVFIFFFLHDSSINIYV